LNDLTHSGTNVINLW